jgi:hypothetical protein
VKNVKRHSKCLKQSFKAKIFQNKKVNRKKMKSKLSFKGINIFSVCHPKAVMRTATAEAGLETANRLIVHDQTAKS